ncbi:hypothetical protein EJ06DRAFT_287997 [Trichodelitschia bisporula]|uniref:Uncharacterized protein n=1 Tax=Trichodelitschia bisporula TaxID=703511 RepID=A0A6G1I5Z3_9PEZI|nr:hypothetical protein EJ06DRAFT_287997 [Trichodelitschia bisporula]
MNVQPSLAHPPPLLPSCPPFPLLLPLYGNRSFPWSKRVTWPLYAIMSAVGYKIPLVLTGTNGLLSSSSSPPLNIYQRPSTSRVLCPLSCTRLHRSNTCYQHRNTSLLLNWLNKRSSSSSSLHHHADHILDYLLAFQRTSFSTCLASHIASRYLMVARLNLQFTQLRLPVY